MSSMEKNKIFAAVLCAGITAMLAGFVAEQLIHTEHMDADAVSIESASGSTGGGGPVKVKMPDPIMDLIATADVARGEKLSKACAACHSFDQGGSNKVGPNLYGVVGMKGSSKDTLKHVHSHVHAIPQCRKTIQRLKLEAHIHTDTAGAAKEVAQRNDPAHGAIASELAAEIYGLEIIERDVQDEHHNTTRFLILGPEPEIPDEDVQSITSLIFSVRNIPASLYKCLGGFATNGLSLSKLESYVDPNFQAAEFFCDIDGHPESDSFKLALEELGFYATDVKFLGAYPAHPFRASNNKGTIIN